MKELICIVCPKGCHLQVDEQNGYAVTGNACPRGEAYGKKELVNPTRTITSTVCIQGAHIPRVPVKTSAEVPKGKIFEAMALLDGLVVQAPVKLGQTIVAQIPGTNAAFVATRSLEKTEETSGN